MGDTVNQWHQSPPPTIAQTLRDALMWRAGESRFAFGRWGVQRVTAIGSFATGEPSRTASPCGVGLASNGTLRNNAGVATKVTTGINSLTAVGSWSEVMPEYVVPDPRFWSNVITSSISFIGYRSGAYYYTFGVGIGPDGSLYGLMRNTAGAYVATGYRAVPYTPGGAPKGAITVALTWSAGEIPFLRAFDKGGRLWCSGAIGAVSLAGPCNIDATPLSFSGETRPDGSYGITIPTTFSGLWDRALSKRELSALAKSIGTVGRSTTALAPRIGVSLAQSLRSTDGVRARTLTNGASLRVRLG